jgi:virginiamycin B lyase
MFRIWQRILKPSSDRSRLPSRSRPHVEVLEDRCVPSGGILEFLIPTAGSGPVGITSGPDGALWFTENATNQIGRVTTTGVVSNEFAIPTSGSDPDGIVAGPDGTLWFTEFFGNKIGRITTAGVVTNEFPILTPNANPKGITVGSDNNLWFVEEQGNKVGQITTAGVITEFSLAAGSNPVAIVSGPDHNLWVTESGTGKIAVLDTSGNLLHEFSLPTAGGSSQDIAVVPDGNLWFAEQSGNTISRITTAGVVTEFALPQAGSAPEGIAAGADGALWFTEGGGGRVGRIATDGAISEFATPTAASHPAGIVLGPDNALWFAERDANRIGRLVPDQPLTGTGASVAATAGLAFSAPVASFTDADATATPASFQAVIAWGDGASSAGVVSAFGSGFVVTGSHTYLSAGNFPVTVTVTDTDTSHDVGGRSATVASAASVALSTLPGFTGTQDQRWLARAYLDLLGRGLDSVGLAGWGGMLANGVSHFAVVDQIERSPEYRVRQVEEVYQRDLGRDADPTWLVISVNYLNFGHAVAELDAILLASPEYALKHGVTDNQGFAAATFQQVLGRPLDAADQAMFGAMLDGGMSRWTFATDLYRSVEGLGLRVQNLYSQYLNRNPESDGLAAWFNGLVKRMPDDAVTAGFVGSDEFFANA